MDDLILDIKNYRWSKILLCASSKRFDQLNIVERWVVFLWLGGSKPSININHLGSSFAKFTFFLKCVQDLESGDQKAAQRFLSQAARWHPNERWMEVWVRIEISGRFNNGKEIPRILKGIRSSDNEDYYYYAILRSCAHKKISKTVRLEIISRLSSNHINGSAILSRLEMTWHPENKLFSLPPFIERSQYENGGINHGMVSLVEAEVNAYLNKYEEALNYYKKSFDQGSVNRVSAQYALQLALNSEGNYFSIILDALTKFSHLSVDLERIITSNLAIKNWLTGEIRAAIEACNSIKDFYTSSPNQITRVSHAYFILISRLIKYVEQNKADYVGDTDGYVHIIGESHCLVGCHFVFSLDGCRKRGKSHLVTGVKMFHLGASSENLFKKSIMNRIKEIPDGETIIFTIGEIDSRLDEGIYMHTVKNRFSLIEAIESTTKNYIDFISKSTQRRRFNIIIQGIPAPTKRPSVSLPDAYLDMVEDINRCLKIFAYSAGFRFFDLYSLTASSNRTSNGLFNLDNFHCSPIIYKNIMQFLSSRSGAD